MHNSVFNRSYRLHFLPTHLPHRSRRQSKRRMIIPQIIRIHLTQPPIPLPPLPHPILPLHKHKQPRARRPTNPQHPQTNPIPRAIPWRLAPQKYITRDNAPQIPEPDLHRATHAALVMPTHQVAHPHQHNRLRDVPSGHDQEQGEVLYARGQACLGEKHNVTHGRDNEPRDAEPVPVPQAVGAVCGEHGGDGGEHEDGDAADLRHGGRVAEFADDGRDEEGACVAGVYDACGARSVRDMHVCKENWVRRTEVRRCAEVDLGVGEDALCGALVQAVHDCVACVCAQARDEECAFRVAEEGGGLGPVADPEFCDEADGDGYDAFDDEDLRGGLGVSCVFIWESPPVWWALTYPAPSAVATYSVHFC